MFQFMLFYTLLEGVSRFLIYIKKQLDIMADYGIIHINKISQTF